MMLHQNFCVNWLRRSMPFTLYFWALLAPPEAIKPAIWFDIERK